MLRLALVLILCVFLARAFWKMVDALIEGITGAPRSGSRVPRQGMQMVRDPVCGTFVLPARAVSLDDGRARVFFCSTACRDKYRARPDPSTGSGSSRATSRDETVEGRTA